MLCAGLGMVRRPAPGAAIFGMNTPPLTIWRFAQDADTLDYRVTDGAGGDRVLEAEWRQGGRVMARTRTQLDAHALPVGARIDFPEAPARLELSVVAVHPTVVIDPPLWPTRR